MTERERNLVRLRTLLDAADLLLSEANRCVPRAEPGDSNAYLDKVLATHNHIRMAERGIHFAKTATMDLDR